MLYELAICSKSGDFLVEIKVERVGSQFSGRQFQVLCQVPDEVACHPLEPSQWVVITDTHALFEKLRVAGQAPNSKNCVRFKLLDPSQTLADLAGAVERRET